MMPRWTRLVLARSNTFTCKFVVLAGLYVANFKFFYFFKVDGIVLTLLSIVIPTLQKEWKLSAIQVGGLGIKFFIFFNILGAAMFIGMLIGALLGSISDRLGRKFVLIVGLFTTAMGTLLNALAFEFWSFFFIRLLTGVGIGVVGTFLKNL